MASMSTCISAHMDICYYLLAVPLSERSTGDMQIKRLEIPKNLTFIELFKVHAIKATC